MGNRRAAQSRLVGKYPTGHTKAYGCPDRCAGKTAGCRCAVECAIKDRRQRTRHFLYVQANHDQAHQYVGNRHGRHDGTGGGSDTLDPAQNDRADDNHQNPTGQRPGNLKLVAQYLRNGIGLDRVRQSKARHAAKQGKRRTQQRITRTQPVADVIHRATAVAAPVILLAITDRQHGLGILHRHAKQCCQPHPEERARAAEGDRCRHAGDVARANGRTEGRHQRPEWRYVTLALTLEATQQQPEREAKPPPRQKPQAQGQENPGTEQQYLHGHTPGPGIDFDNKGFHYVRISLISVLGEHISASRGLPNTRPSIEGHLKEETRPCRCHQLVPVAAFINWGSWANKPNTPPV